MPLISDAEKPQDLIGEQSVFTKIEDMLREEGTGEGMGEYVMECPAGFLSRGATGHLMTRRVRLEAGRPLS